MIFTWCIIAISSVAALNCRHHHSRVKLGRGSCRLLCSYR